MKVEVEKMKLSEGTYSRKVGDRRYYWDVPTLISFVKEKGYKSFKLPIEGIDLSALMFTINNTKDFTEHVRRVQDTNLEYPILIDDLGTICDGWHRVVKAMLEGKTYIEAIRIKKMPIESSSQDI